jgi:predicted AAA+ superfamily ATPase
MRRRYIPRALEPLIRKAAARFPAVVLTGSRQLGKTTQSGISVLDQLSC